MIYYKCAKHIVYMAIVLAETSGEGCSPIVLIALLFPPLLLIFGIYYLCKQIWHLGFLLLVVFCIEGAVLGFLLNAYLPACGICFDEYYCMSTKDDTTSLCMKCPLDTTVYTCDKIAATSKLYDYVFSQCTYQCMQIESCTDTDPVEPGYFCNVIRDIGTIAQCPEVQNDCDKVVFNTYHYPNICRKECFANTTYY